MYETGLEERSTQVYLDKSERGFGVRLNCGTIYGRSTRGNTKRGKLGNLGMQYCGKSTKAEGK